MLGKYLQRKLDTQKYPVLIIQKTKHESYYYVANSKAGFLKACLDMLKVNNQIGYYYKPDPPRLEDALSAEQAEALPAEYAKQEKVKIARNKQAQRRYEEELEDWNNIQKALKEKDGEAAYQALDARNGAEYERFEIEEVKAYE